MLIQRQGRMPPGSSSWFPIQHYLHYASGGVHVCPLFSVLFEEQCERHDSKRGCLSNHKHMPFQFIPKTLGHSLPIAPARIRGAHPPPLFPWPPPLFVFLLRPPCLEVRTCDTSPPCPTWTLSGWAEFLFLLLYASGFVATGNPSLWFSFGFPWGFLKADPTPSKRQISLYILARMGGNGLHKQMVV